MIVLHEVRGCTCGCGGRDERSARTERRTYISIALVANHFDVKSGHVAGRPRGFEDDDGCLRAA